MPSSLPPLVLARNAMATRFEIVLPGENLPTLRAAGEEALDEVERVENLLSLYKPDSEVSRLNACAGKEEVKVDPELFGLIQRAMSLSAETQGLFDLTLGPLMRAWGMMGGNRGTVPNPNELAEARAKVGMELLELNAAKTTIRFKRTGVMLDFGAIGKGYAIERAARLLREAGILSALIHGGTSTVYGMGLGPDGKSWKVAIEYPQNPDSVAEVLAIVPLRDEALSVSAVWGKSFTAQEKTYGHVMDPRTGEPASKAVLSAVIVPEATDSDALSTALLAGGEREHEKFSEWRPEMRNILLENADEKGEARVHSRGIELRKRG
ncbi:MAG TPA: FAD:protein FMN transferase [Candidatus Saccharimonadales bacterium]|nr:FAD:protein FMN transferase [Candidatus Saccharimonadales bacterium]